MCLVFVSCILARNHWILITSCVFYSFLMLHLSPFWILQHCFESCSRMMSFTPLEDDDLGRLRPIRNTSALPTTDRQVFRLLLSCFSLHSAAKKKKLISLSAEKQCRKDTFWMTRKRERKGVVQENSWKISPTTY